MKFHMKYTSHPNEINHGLFRPGSKTLYWQPLQPRDGQISVSTTLGASAHSRYWRAIRGGARVVVEQGSRVVDDNYRWIHTMINHDGLDYHHMILYR